MGTKPDRARKLLISYLTDQQIQDTIQERNYRRFETRLGPYNNTTLYLKSRSKQKFAFQHKQDT